MINGKITLKDIYDIVDNSDKKTAIREAKTDKRLGNLEKWRWILTGAIATSGAIGAFPIVGALASGF